MGAERGAAIATVHTPDGVVSYDGDVAIAGVPGTAAPVVLNFENTAGPSCGALLPTGEIREVIDGISVTCVDNGMPVVVLPGEQLGVTGRGRNTPQTLEADREVHTPLRSWTMTVTPPPRTRILLADTRTAGKLPDHHGS